MITLVVVLVLVVAYLLIGFGYWSHAAEIQEGIIDCIVCTLLSPIGMMWEGIKGVMDCGWLLKEAWKEIKRDDL